MAGVVLPIPRLDVCARNLSIEQRFDLRTLSTPSFDRRHADVGQELDRRGGRLLLVGDGPERKRFEATLASRGLLDRAHFTGALSYDRVPDLYQQMDMLVVPTQTTNRIREQFGRVLVEAMASGLPVIGSTCGAIPEVIDDAGLIVPEGNSAALAAALRRLLLDCALREELTRAGRRRVMQHYSWDRVADKMHEMFRQILRNEKAAALSQNLEFAAVLSAARIHHTYLELQGGHNWALWRGMAARSYLVAARRLAHA